MRPYVARCATIKDVARRDSWVREVLRVANDPLTDPEIRSRLRAAIRGQLRDLMPVPLPAAQVSVMNGRVAVRSELPLPITVSGQHAWDYAKRMIAVALSPRGRRLHVCDHCEKVFEGKGAFKRTRFCSEKHRRAWDRAHRDPKEQAAYMRQYRRRKKLERSRRRRKV